MTVPEKNVSRARTVAGPLLTAKRPLFTTDSKLFFLLIGQDVAVHSTSTNQRLRTLSGHTANVTDAALNPTNKLQLYTCAVDQQVCLWDYADGVLLHKWATPFAPLNLKIFPNCPNKAILVGWSIATPGNPAGTIVATAQLNLDKSQPMGGNLMIISHLLLEGFSLGSAFDTTANHMACVTSNDCYVIDVSASLPPLLVHRHTQSEDQFGCIAMHPYGSAVAVGDMAGRIHMLYRAERRERGGGERGESVRQILHWHHTAVKDMCFTSDGLYLVSGGHEAVLVIWQLATREKQFIARLGAPITALAITPNSQSYITSHSDNSLRLINAQTREVIWSLRGLVGTSRAHTLNRVAHHPAQHHTVVVGLSDRLQVYDMLRERHVADLELDSRQFVSKKKEMVGTETTVQQIVFANHGEALVTCERVAYKSSVSFKLRFWAAARRGGPDIVTYTETTCAVDAHSANVTGIASSPNKAMVATCSLDGSFKIWILNDENDKNGSYWFCTAKGTYQNRPAHAVAFSDDGSLLAVAFEQTITLWVPESLVFLSAIGQGRFSGAVQLVEFVPGTPYMLVMCQNDVTAWNLVTSSVWWTLPLRCTSLAVNPINRRVALGLYPRVGKAPIIELDIEHGKVVEVVGVEAMARGLGYIDGTLCVAAETGFALYGAQSERDGEERGAGEGGRGRRGVVGKAANNVYLALFGAEDTTTTDTQQSDWISTGHPSAIGTVSRDLLTGPSHVLPPVSSIYETFMGKLLTRFGSRGSTNEEITGNEPGTMMA